MATFVLVEGRTESDSLSEKKVVVTGREVDTPWKAVDEFDETENNVVAESKVDLERTLVLSVVVGHIVVNWVITTVVIGLASAKTTTRSNAPAFH